MSMELMALAVLLQWLKEEMPDIVCLQELKATQDEFPEKAIKEAGHTAIWHGQKQWNGVAILARNIEIEEITRFLPGDDDDIQSRYSEALINGVVIVCIYLPNGNPAPGRKFDYKLQWFKKLTERAATLIDLKIPVILIGYNVMPTELDVYKPEKWAKDALFGPEVRQAFKDIVSQGWTDASEPFIQMKKFIRFRITSEKLMKEMPAFGLTFFSKPWDFKKIKSQRG